MTRIAQRTRHKGVFTAEVIVGIALLSLAIAGLAISVLGISRFNRYEWTCQRCTAAASAQLDSLAATGKPIADAEIERLWPQVNVATERTGGSAPWDGLELLRVTATGKAGARVVTVCLTRYLRKDY
jgi:type II secretory pathway pseudopilin PulG